MKTCLLSMMFMSLCPFLLTAQVDTAWVRRFNGSGNAGDYAQDIAVDDSGYVYVTGGSVGIGTDYDDLTIKYDPSGDTVWVRRYNAPGFAGDGGDVIVVDQSGNVYVTGFGARLGGGIDCATLKYYPNGDTAWVRMYDGPASYYNEAFGIAVDNAGNVYASCESAGYGTSADYATLKYYPNGDTAWVRRYNGPANGSDVVWSLAIDGLSNVYVTGESQGLGGSADYVTIKYYASGDTAWVRRYNGSGNDYDRAYDIAVDSSGGVYVTGGSSGFGTSLDCLTIKYDSYGNVVWARMYNGPADGWDEARAIAIDDSCNVYITGESQGLGGSADYVTIKYYANGDTAWVRRYNGSGNDYDRAYDIAVDSSGGVYVTGGSHGYGTSLDYATIKYGPNGDPVWCMRYNAPENSWDDARNMTIDNSGNVYVTGHAAGLGPYADFVTIKYVQTTEIKEEDTFASEHNAFTTTILSGPLQLPEGKKCRIFDITGRVVEPDRITPGIYFLEIDNKVVQKVIKIK